MTRLTASRRRQRPQHVADACGLPLNENHLIHSRVEYNRIEPDRSLVMKTHRIRLAGPWDSQLTDDDGQPVGEVIRCQLPFTLPDTQRESAILLTRGFHCPTGIDDTTTLRIVLQATESPNAVRINGTDIAECPARLNAEFAFDITGRVAAFNQLSVLFKSAEYEPSAALNMAWLEIQG